MYINNLHDLIECYKKVKIIYYLVNYREIVKLFVHLSKNLIDK